ncbi:MAG TPA: dienelactone hydrolase family protein [Terriglobia bacterium]|nr:dienelactone hydrolase family protein [Terriglobia bacterium]
MYRERPAETDQEHVEDLIHLYIDGAFDRRELLKRVARYTGSVAAAMAAVGPEIMAQTAAPSGTPANASVPEEAPDVQWFWVQYAGEAGTLNGYFARPRFETRRLPAILVIHENRGLNDHIKDVVRRVARAGFVGMGVDLLSRVGGTAAFSDPLEATQALNRTTVAERLSDLRSSIRFLQIAEHVRQDQIGALGFCFGGGLVFSLAFDVPELVAAVPYYGTPPNPLPSWDRMNAKLLAIFSETDYTQNGRIPEVVSGMVQRRKTMGLHLYQGTAHGFHNDTSPIYNAGAAADAWSKTIAFFRTHLSAEGAGDPSSAAQDCRVAKVSRRGNCPL